MDFSDRDPMVSRARRAYELGRVRLGVVAGAYIVPIAAFSLLAGADWPVTGAFAALLAISIGTMVWHGRSIARGVGPGLVTGVTASLIPIAVRGGHCCSGPDCAGICLAMCIVAGTLGGAWLGVRAASEQEGRAGFVFGAVVSAGLAGSMGCAAMGLTGMVGIGAALLVSSLSSVMLRTRTAHH